MQWLPILGTVESVSQVKDGELSITMAPLSYTVLKADRKFTPTQALSIKLNAPKIDYSTENWFALSANVPGNDYVEVTFAIREKVRIGGFWALLTTELSPVILSLAGFIGLSAPTSSNQGEHLRLLLSSKMHREPK